MPASLALHPFAFLYTRLSVHTAVVSLHLQAIPLHSVLGVSANSGSPAFSSLSNPVLSWSFLSYVASASESACQCRRRKRHGFDPWVGKIPWRRAWQPTPVFLPGESQAQRRLAGYSPWGRKQSDPTNTFT